MNIRPSIYQFGQRNQWLIVVVIALLLLETLLNQLHFNNDRGWSSPQLNDFPEMFQRVFSYAMFGKYGHNITYFTGQLHFCLVIIQWSLLIVGTFRYFSEKRSATVLKFAALFLLWLSLFELIKRLFFWQFNLHYNSIFTPFLGISDTVQKIVLPILFALILLAFITPRTNQPVASQPNNILNRWQRGLHFFLDRVIIWFCGYNYFLMDALFDQPTFRTVDRNLFPIIGIALFVTQLIVLPFISEGLFGITLGKLLTGTKVVGRNGSPISLKQAFLRSLIRLIPFNWISVFTKKGLWIDRWSNTQVVVVHQEEPLKRLHKLVQLGTGTIFFIGAWFLVLMVFFTFQLIPTIIHFRCTDFPFLLIVASFPLIVLFQSFWMASLLDHFRSARDNNAVSSNDALIRSFYCWIPILNFYYLATHLEEITSHMEHSDSSKEYIDRVGKHIRQFSNVFALVYLFVLGLIYPFFVNANPFPIMTVMILLIMLGCFFAWRLSYAIAHMHVKQAETTDLLDDLS